MPTGRICQYLTLLVLSISVSYATPETSYQITTTENKSSVILWKNTGSDLYVTLSGENKASTSNTIKLSVFFKTTSLRPNKFELLSSHLAPSDKLNNKWQYEIKLSDQSILITENYRIDICNESREINSHYLAVITPSKSNHRQNAIHQLYKIINKIYALNQELNNAISTIENTKRVKSGWERNILQTIGIYNRPEEALALSIKKWRDWEKKYTRELDTVIELITTLHSISGLPYTQEKISHISGHLYEKYAHYRFQLLGAPRKISYSPEELNTLTPDENKNKMLSALAKEVTSKIFQDTLSLMEYLDSEYITIKEPWEQIQKKSTELCAKLNKEIEAYHVMGLFQKEKHKAAYNTSLDLTELINELSVLMEKIAPPSNSNINSEETQNAINKLHYKISLIRLSIY